MTDSRAALSGGEDVMRLTGIDIGILVGFILLLVGVAVYTKRSVKSVAGFLSADRCAGRYLLTMAQAMATMSAIGQIGAMEGAYYNGFGGMWWGLMFMPLGVTIALSGFVTYRYRETRALTMPQFLEKRYSRNFRTFAGTMGFVSGILNCGVFPAVTTRFIIYFCGIPQHVTFAGIECSSYAMIMLLVVAAGATLALSGGQITVMVTDFFAGMVANIGTLTVIGAILLILGWDPIMDAIARLPDITRDRQTMIHPFKQGDLPNFGIGFFVMICFTRIFTIGIWQGGAGYMTAAKSPHESRMANILSDWRSMGQALLILLVGTATYAVLNDPAFAAYGQPANDVIAGISDAKIVSSMRAPIMLSHLLPAGAMGLYLVFMLGAAVSTDDSAYHSWGSLLLQDVIMPWRRKPFSREEHLRYLRYAIAAVAVFAYTFSLLFPLKDFIQMWFQVTGAIFIGGAGSAIIGGLYWKRGTTAGAWAGMITGSTLAVSSIIVRQVWSHVPFLAGIAPEMPVNGLHMATISTASAVAVYVVTSLLTFRQPCNMDRLLNRGTYSVGHDHDTVTDASVTLIERKLGITKEFSLFDKTVYIIQILWVATWVSVFVLGTVYNLTHDVPEATWRKIVGVIFTVNLAHATIVIVWYGIGGTRDLLRLFRSLKQVRIDDADDGTEHGKQKS